MRRKLKEALKGFRVIWRYASVYKRELITLSIFGIFSALANGSIPYVMGKFLDAILIPGSVVPFLANFLMPLWSVFLGIWIMSQLVALGADWKNQRMVGVISERLFVDYWVSAKRTLLGLPLSFFKNAKMGEITNAFNKAADAMYSITGRIIVHIAPQILSIVVGLAFAFLMNASLAMILLLGMFAYVLILFKLVPSAVPLQRSMHKAWGDSFAEINQTLTGVVSVKQFGLEDLQVKKIGRKFEKAFKLGSSINHIWANIDFSQRWMVVSVQVIIFILSVALIQKGGMTIGELLAFNGYTALVFTPLMFLGKNWQTVQNGLTALERAEEILNEKLEDYSPRGAVKDFPFNGVISFKDVSFGYRKGQNILNNVSFETKAGEVVALVGESGAGKSTLIDLISGYYFPSTGVVTVDGHSTKKIDLRFLRKNIAIVPQEVALFHDTVKSNIVFGLSGVKDEEVRRVAELAHADAFIKGFPKKYQQIVGERGVKLSVGQKQRIAIARAILRNPKILILDEPTSALDSETEKYVTEALDKVMQGRTTFIIAHRLSTVRKADKILVLEGGKIIESGTHTELMNIEGGNYRQRYELHLGLE